MKSNLLLMVFGVILMGCSEVTPATHPTAPPSPQVQLPVIGQTLPISAQATIANQTIDLEVALTPEQQAMGLMYRTTLAQNRGMLFPFNPPQPVKFWMKNVRIPLDMIFLQDGVVKAIAANVPPCTTAECSTYGPITPIDQVIELRGGRSAQLSLKVGQTVTIKFLHSERLKKAEG